MWYTLRLNGVKIEDTEDLEHIMMTAAKREGEYELETSTFSGDVVRRWAITSYRGTLHTTLKESGVNLGHTKP